MRKNIKQCKTLPICAVHYAICQSDPYLHRHCLNFVASHTLHSYVCTVYTAHYIHVPFHDGQLINEVKRSEQLYVCPFESSMCMCALYPFHMCIKTGLNRVNTFNMDHLTQVQLGFNPGYKV